MHGGAAVHMCIWHVSSAAGLQHVWSRSSVLRCLACVLHMQGSSSGIISRLRQPDACCIGSSCTALSAVQAAHTSCRTVYAQQFVKENFSSSSSSIPRSSAIHLPCRTAWVLHSSVLSLRCQPSLCCCCCCFLQVLKTPVSRDMLGRIFNGSGRPIDGG
jgi:hypothetical protein